jgi:hypothetical protein
MTDAQGPTGGDELLPTPLSALEDDRDRIVRIMDRLAEETLHEERADLATELVRAGSRYLDVMERAVLPVLGDEESDEDAAQRSKVRDRMEYIHQRTKHMAARNAHMGDPDGLEAAIEDVSIGLRERLAADDRVIDQVRQLSSERAEHLAAAVDKVSRHASERPRPLPTPLGRLLSNASTKLDHTFEDISSPRHPGAETIDDNP